MTKPRKNRHGGPRKGAGRPKMDEKDKPVAMTIRMHETIASKFRQLCTNNRLSQRKMFALLVMAKI